VNESLVVSAPAVRQRAADAENAAIDVTDPASGPRLAFHKVPEPTSRIAGRLTVRK